jgi:hypothetical protein
MTEAQDSRNARREVFFRCAGWALITVGVLGILLGCVTVGLYIAAVVQELDPGIDTLLHILAGFVGCAFAIFMGLRARRLPPSQTE